MSPARQANVSPDPTDQAERNAISRSVAAKKRRHFDPHAFLATIGEARKFVPFQKKQASSPKGISLMQCFMFSKAR
jgi:hypothetical protein